MTDPHMLDSASPEFSTRSDAVIAARDAHFCAKTPYGWAILRHRAVGRLLRDRRLRQGSHAWPARHGMTGRFSHFWAESVIGREGPPHQRLRRAATGALSPEFVAELAPGFDRIAADLAAKLDAGGKAEFMQDFAFPFAGQAIALLLGLPADDWPRLAHDASDLGLAMGVECARHEARIDAAYGRLEDLAGELIARARKSPGADYVSRLVARVEADGGWSEAELNNIIVMSIFGGVDTTRSQLGLGMALFIDHPGQWNLLRADPGLAPNAVEEMIRARPTTTWSSREALEDFEFEGVTFKKGETLHLLVHASARDPEICADPVFDIQAERKAHFGFGGGAHHCIGHLMARTDMAAALRALAVRLAWFDYDPDDPPVFLPDSGNTSPERLPLRYRLA